MFFFVNQYLLSSNSSIEHAEIKRLKLFKEHKTAAKLVTRDFDNIIHATLGRFGLSDDQLVNMFDFFAGTTDYQGHNLHTKDLNLPIDYQVSSGSNSRTVKDGDRLVAEVFFIGGTYGLVDHVDYYDAAGNINLRAKYDIRGFKAVDIFFGKSNRPYYERYYRPDGSNYMERYYVQSTEDTPINSLNVLKNYQGKDRFFDDFDSLFAFFLKELNDQIAGTNTFIADRPAVSIKPVQQLGKRARKFLWLPISHIDDGQDLINGPLNGFLNDPLTKDRSKWDGIIVMTAMQAAVLQQRLGKGTPIYTINGSPVHQASKRVPMEDRTPNQLIYVGRLGSDKGTDLLIKLFAKVHQAIRDSKLTFYGYGSNEDTKNYQDLVKKLKLEKAVTFAGYQPKLDDVYNQAQLFVDPGRLDSQPLAMAEALAHGVPVISFNYLYGPSEFVKDGVNGQLIRLDNMDKMPATIIDLLKSPAKLQQLSTGAYENCQAFDADHTWVQWQAIMNK